MVLPLLFSLGLPALAAAAPAGGVLAGLGATLGTAGMAGLGAGLGSFLQSGDIGEGIKTGLASFLGGKVLGGLTGSTSANAINAGQGIQTEAFGELAQPKFLQTLPGLTEQGGLLASQGMQQAAAGAFAPGVMPAAFIGQTMSDAYAMNRAAKKDDDDDSNDEKTSTEDDDAFGDTGPDAAYTKEQMESLDLVPFWVSGLDSSTPVFFRTLVTSLTETASPSWSSGNFVGNPYKYYTYEGVERNVSFSLNSLSYLLNIFVIKSTNFSRLFK
mgnify:CR=1 FL=1